ncbi:MAG: dihydroneopterin aldolase [Bacteroidales bacterium]|nr:dihydroneopterin aldolase [Bacteroidales bacterium]
MQYIELKQISFHGYHGVMEQEKKVGNTYTIDLSIYFDFSNAAISDKLEDTINYASVYEVIKQEMSVPSNLIEHLAARIVDRIKITFPHIQNIKIRLAKKNPPFGGDIKEVAVVLSDL